MILIGLWMTCFHRETTLAMSHHKTNQAGLVYLWQTETHRLIVRKPEWSKQHSGDGSNGEKA